jgi:transposase-like protein
MRVGLAWISLDSLVRIVTYQWVIRDKRAKNVLVASCMGLRSAETEITVEAIRKRRIVHGASLALFLIFRNQLSALIALSVGLVQTGRVEEDDSMRAEDFSDWLSAIAGMSAEQRRQALQRLATADGEAGASGEGVASGKGGKRGRGKDALGTASVERVESQGCPHCAGREIVGWGRSNGLLRFRCKSCGRTFNALTKTPMAHLRKKERWLDHAQAMIEGMSLAKTAKLCGVHPTTAFRWRHRFLRAPADDKPRTLSGIVEADETFILESFKGRWSDLPRKA